MADSNEPVSKVEFVWLMVQLAESDREMYRLMRERGWLEAAKQRMLVGKSEKAN